jgi:hypothetical protein
MLIHHQIEARVVGDHMRVEIAIVKVAPILGSKCLFDRFTLMLLSESIDGR